MKGDTPRTVKEHEKYKRHIRRIAGSRGGRAPHAARGLSAMTPERLAEVRALGLAKRRARKEAREDAG